MKILFFDNFRLGVLGGQEVIDVSQGVRDIPYTGPHDGDVYSIMRPIITIPSALEW